MRCLSYHLTDAARQADLGKLWHVNFSCPLIYLSSLIELLIAVLHRLSRFEKADLEGWQEVKLSHATTTTGST